MRRKDPVAPQPLPQRRQWPDPLGDAAGGQGAGQRGPAGPGRLPRAAAAGMVWQCAICLALFGSSYAAKMHVIKTKPGSIIPEAGAAGAAAAAARPRRPPGTAAPPAAARAAAAADQPTSRTSGVAFSVDLEPNSCSQTAVILAKRKSRETGRFVSLADVAIVKWSVNSESLARSRLAGGNVSLDCSADREILELARNQRALELQIEAFVLFNLTKELCLFYLV